MTTRWQNSPWIYIDRVQDLRPPALNWDVCTTDDGVHLDQAGILQSNNEVVAQRQKPLQLHDQIHTNKHLQMFKHTNELVIKYNQYLISPDDIGNFSGHLMTGTNLIKISDWNGSNMTDLTFLPG